MTEKVNTNNEKSYSTKKSHTGRKDSWDSAKTSIKHALHDAKCASHSLYVVARDSTEGLHSRFNDQSVNVIKEILEDIADQASSAREHLSNRERTVKDVHSLKVGEKIRVSFKDSAVTEIVGDIEDIDFSGSVFKVVADNTSDAGANGVVVEIKVEEAHKIKKVVSADH